MKRIFIIITSILLFSNSASLFGQLTVQGGLTASDMANSITGDGVTILNPQVIGSPGSYGGFEANGIAGFNLQNGVLLTTGLIGNAIGPNLAENTTTSHDGIWFSDVLDSIANFGNPGDPLPIKDACTLEFDIIPDGDTLKFNFSFASEEYNEFVCTPYDDIFGFFISGPGIVGKQNIALIPGTNTPVTINNVNHGNPTSSDPCPSSNEIYHVENPLSAITAVQYDGWTTGIQAIAGGLTPCAVYHLEIVIADVNDRLYDSGVFIEKIESNNIQVDINTVGNTQTMIEGCNNGIIEFCATQPVFVDLTLEYLLQGSAINGVDYDLIEVADPNVPKTVVIPAGSSCATVNINTIDDGTPEVDEYVDVILLNPVCDGLVTDSVRAYIIDELSIEIVGDDSICAGESIFLEAVGAANTYQWGPANVTFVPASNVYNPIVTLNETTTVSVTTTVAGCVAQDDFTIGVTNFDLDFSFTPDGCSPNSCDGAISLVVTGGVEPYSYDWGNGDTTSTITGVCGGLYTLSVLDASGCTRRDTVELMTGAEMTMLLSPTVFNGGYNVACSGDANGSVTAVVSGGVGNITYQWDDANNTTTSTLTGVGAGTYTVTAIDSQGCEVVASITLTEPPVLSVSVVNVTDVICGGNTGAIEVLANGGTPGYTYTWTLGADVVGSGVSISNLEAGTYLVTVLDQNNCSQTLEVVVAAPVNPLTATSVTTNITCFGDTDGAITVTGQGGAIDPGSDYQYLWLDDNSTNPFRGGLSPGLYQVQITDDNNCSIVYSVTITGPSAPLGIQIISQENITCSGSCTNVEVVGQGGTPGYSYEWNTVPAGAQPLGTNSTLEVCIPGDYQVQVTDDNGCVETTNMTITIVSPPMSINATVTDANCSGDNSGAIDVTVNGGVTPYASYTWTSTCGMGPLFSEDINNVCAGIWTLEVVDAVGCTQSFNLTVSELSNIQLTYNATPTLCVDDSSGAIDITPSGGVGGYSFEWFGPAPFIGGPIDMNVVLSTNEDISNMPKGEYLVVVTDGLGCSFMQNIIITAPAAITIDLDDMSNYNGFGVSCNGSCNGFINVTVVGGTSSPEGDYTFIWQDQQQGFVSNVSGVGAEDISGLCASQDLAGYELVVVDDNNCIQNAFFTVTEPDPIVITFSTVTDPSCSGGSNGTITPQVSGGVPNYSYAWREGNDVNLPVISTSLVLADVPAGLYCLTVTDANGCSETECVTLVNPPMLDVSLTFVDQGNGFAVSCFGDNDAVILSNVSGGDGNYTYNWSDCVNPPFAVGVVPSVSGLTTGSYCLEVTDGAGCTGTATIFLPSPTQISNNAVVEDISCDVGNGGAITLNPTGGSGVYPIIDWTPDGFIPDGAQGGAGLPAGDYHVYIEDSNGCSADFDFVIAGSAAINVTLISPQLANGFNVSCNGLCDASIEANIVGGTGTPTISWVGAAPVGGTPGNVTQFDGVVCAGVYTINVTDGTCVGTDQITITEPPLITVDIQELESISCSGLCDGQLMATASGGGGGYTYQWDGQASGAITEANLCVGEHCVTVTDITGCSVEACYTIAAPAPLNVVITPMAISCNDMCDGGLSVNVNGGTPGYTYSWSGPDGFSSIDPAIVNLCAGLYNLQVTDASECVENTSFNLIQPAPLDIEINVSDYNGTGVSCANTCDGSIDVVNLGGGALTYEWVGPGNPAPTGNLTDLCAGTYILTTSSGGTCNRVDTIVVSAPEAIAITLDSELFPGGTNISCVGDATGSITSVVEGGVTDYTYTWVSNNVTIAENVTEIDGLVAGTYTLEIVDANGCPASVDYTLTEPDEPFSVTMNIAEFPGGTNTSCGNACDGSATTIVQNGLGTIDYLWTGPDLVDETNNSVDSLCSGIYVVVATDENECVATAIDTLVAAPMLEILSAVDSVLCFGQSVGAIDVTVLGGIPALNYEWTNGNDTIVVEDLVNIPAGTYALTVTDSLGCQAFQEFILVQPDTISVSLFPSEPSEAPGFNISAPNAMDGSINAMIEGGVEPYVFQWIGPDGIMPDDTPFINNLDGGQYCVGVTDANDCVFGICIELLEPLELHLPHGMSPNGDGINDGLIIEGLELYPKNVVRVFNRWGNIVFERNDYSNTDTWKGEGKNGNFVPDGTYFVVVELIGSEKELHGYLEVRR